MYHKCVTFSQFGANFNYYLLKRLEKQNPHISLQKLIKINYYKIFGFNKLQKTNQFGSRFLAIWLYLTNPFTDDTVFSI